MQEPDIIDILRKSWDNFKLNAKVLTLVATFGGAIPTIAYTAFSLYRQFTELRGNVPPNAAAPFISLVYAIILCIFIFVTYMGLINICNKILKNEPVTYKDAFLTNDQLGELVKAGCLLGFLSGIGYICCIIPGTIVSFIFTFVPYILIIYPRKSIGESFTASRKLTIKYLKTTFIIALIVFAINTIAGASLIGIIISMPLSVMINTVLFTTLAEIENNNDKANNVLR